MRTARGSHYKQHFEANVGYECDGKTQPVPTVKFDLDSVEPPEQTTSEPAPDRDEVEALLKRCGVAKAQREVVLARSFDRKSVRQIASEVRRSKTWVAKTLKRTRPLLEGRGAQAAVSPGKPCGMFYELKPSSLREAMDHAHERLDNYFTLASPDVGHMAAGLAELGLPPGASEAQKVVATVALWPGMLSRPGVGTALAGKLGEVITAARYGSRKEAAPARKALAMLTRYRQGNRCPVPDEVLGSESLEIVVTLEVLQRTWRERRIGQPQESREARMEAIREQLPGLVEGFTDKELLPRLQGHLLESAAWFAEKGTGIAAEAFVRAWRRISEVKALAESLRS